MERNYNYLSTVAYQSILREIVFGVREKAMTIEEFTNEPNGAIRITVAPLFDLAEQWLGGGLSDFRHQCALDPCEREFIFKLFPAGSHTMQYKCDDGHIEPVNCYGYSALKVAYVSWERKFRKKVTQNEVPETLEDAEFQRQTQYLVPENGYTNDKGCVSTTVLLNGEPFLRIYVTVSGAQEGEIDEECALAGLLAAQEFLSDISDNSDLQLDKPLRFTFEPDLRNADEGV